jgi:hypothetical protein
LLRLLRNAADTCMTLFLADARLQTLLPADSYLAQIRIGSAGYFANDESLNERPQR